MSKVCIVAFHNLHLMQFLYKYTSILDSENIEYDILYWDRDVDDKIPKRKCLGNTIAFRYKMNTYQPKYKKIMGFIHCVLFFRRKILEGNYDKLIFLTTQAIFPLYLLSKKIFKNKKYIYDYRDITYEKIPICKNIIKKMINNSEFTAISSYGFKEVLGESDKFLISHNTIGLDYTTLDKKPSDKLRIVYWGIVRQLEFNKKLCDTLGSNNDTELTYHGEGVTDLLKDYCNEKGYNQIKFTGRYTVDEIESFAENTDILVNLYNNNKIQKLATTVKLYDGIRYGLPMLVTKDSYMDTLMKDNPYVLAIDLETVKVEDIVSWYLKLDKDKYPYSRELEIIKKDDEVFKERLLDFIRK